MCARAACLEQVTLIDDVASFRHQIKPDNVLMSEDHQIVKLCDFGVSEMFSEGDDRMKKNAGSPAFMSPETVICERDEDDCSGPPT